MFLSTKWGEVPVIRHLPDEFRHYDVPDATCHFGSKESLGVFIFHQIPIGPITAWFIHLLPRHTFPLFLVDNGPIIVFQVSKLNKLEMNVEGVGEMQLHERSYNFFFQPRLSLEWRLDRRETAEFQLCIPVGYFNEFRHRYDLLEPFLGQIAKGRPARLKKSGQGATQLLVRLIQLFQTSPESRQELVPQILEEALIAMKQASLKKKPRITTEEAAKFYKAKDRLLSDLSATFALEELAVAVGLNAYRLQKCFQVLIHQSYTTYLWEQRMLKAESLLRSTHQFSIAEVARMVGYEDQGAFSKAFYRYFGTNPIHLKVKKTK